ILRSSVICVPVYSTISSISVCLVVGIVGIFLVVLLLLSLEPLGGTVGRAATTLYTDDIPKSAPIVKNTVFASLMYLTSHLSFSGNQTTSTAAISDMIATSTLYLK